ncbi:MAG: hypothetical protein V2A34_11155 [Lentisphaerota bacterium]
MKKAGIAMIVIGLVLLLVGLVLPGEAGEEKNFIKAGVEIEDSAQGQDPSAGQVLQQTGQDTEIFKDRLVVKGKHIMTAGLVVSLVGFGFFIAGLARRTGE